ncbi:MAG: MFS transporter [Hyphomicrobiales bacterium]|nr:MFS transporter [Hyphomicrobiales bacterium]
MTPLKTSGPAPSAINQHTPRLLLRVCLPFAFGYFLSYLYRAINAVIAPDLVTAFALDADDLGLLTGAYFLTFALAQIPLGIALDRFGPRRTEAVLLVFAAGGAATFALAGDLEGLILGRALIGLGVSACLMAAFKAFALWFPKERLPLINGVQMAAGGLGALMATTPVQAALSITDWRGVFFCISVLTVLSAAAILIIVPGDRDRCVQASVRELWGGVVRIYTSTLFWRYAPVTVLSQASFLAIQSLWTGPWLAEVEAMPRSDVAVTLLAIATAMTAGFLVLGWTAERLGRKGIRPMHVAFVGMAAFMASQVVIICGWGSGLTLPWLAFGFFGTTGILPYAALSQSFPLHLAGRVNTALNVLVFITAFLAQWAIGGVIDAWPGVDPKQGYRAAFSMMLALQGFAALWFMTFRRDGVPAD